MIARRNRVSRSLRLEQLEGRQMMSAGTSLPGLGLALPPGEVPTGFVAAEVAGPTAASPLSTGGTVTAAAPTVYTLNARNFGAKGDGKTDDTRALQVAIYAAANAGFRLQVPAGTYVVSFSGPTQVLRIPSNLEMFGAGMGKTILKLKSGQGDFAPVLHGTGANNVKIRDLTIDGNRAGQSVPTAEHSPAIWLDGGSAINVTRVEMKNAQGDGILIRGDAANVVVDQCRAINVYREGVGLGTGYRNVTVSNSYLEAPVHSEPENGAVCDGVTVVNNTIRSPLYSISVGGYSATAPTRNWTIKNNTLYGSISVGRAENVVIDGNNITGSALPYAQARPAIYGVYHSRNVQLTNNRIQGIVRDVIYLGAVGSEIPQYWTITGNSLFVPAGYKPFTNRGGLNVTYVNNLVTYL